MRILVFGGNGFIGSNLIDKLIERGNHVRVFDRFPEKFRGPLANVEYIKGDLSDIPLVSEALEEIDIVVHLISTTIPSSSDTLPETDVTGNLVGTLRLIQTMKSKNVRKIIYFSSGGTVYGNPSKLPVTENSVLNPISSYGIVKVAIEKYLLMFQKQGVLDPIIIRPSNPYGERQNFERPIGLISHAIFLNLLRRPIQIWGDGTVIRDFIYINDLIEHIVTAISNYKTGIFNVGYGSGTSVNQVLRIISQVTGVDNIVEHKSVRNYDVKEIYLDCQTALNTFGWSPKVTLTDGIQRTYDWIKDTIEVKNNE